MHFPSQVIKLLLPYKQDKLLICTHFKNFKANSELNIEDVYRTLVNQSNRQNYYAPFGLWGCPENMSTGRRVFRDHFPPMSQA